MPNVVSIQVRVDDNNSAQVIGQTENALKNLGTTGQTAGQQVGAGMAQIGRHTTTSLDQIRLLSQEFGLRLPRAMEAALSRMPALTAAVGSFSGAILAIGAAEVFVRMGTAIYDAEQKYISITAAADKFYETLKKTTELDFTNTRDLETTGRRLDIAQQSMVASQQLAPQMQKAGLMSILQGLANPAGAGSGIGMILGAHDIAGDGAKASGQVLELTRKQIDQTHEQALAQIELNHAMDETLQKRQQIAAAATKEQQISAENRKYDHNVQGFYGNPTGSAAGASAQNIKDAQAQADAAKKTIDLNNEVQGQIMKARAAAVEAGLQGEALYAQKQKDAIAEVIQALNAQHMAEEIPARVRALNAQYDAERLARLRDLTAETQRMNAETASAGLTGASKILAERNSAIGGINAKQSKYAGGAPLDAQAQSDFDQQRADANASANQKIEALESSFNERVTQMEDQRVQASLNGYAKIEAAAAKEVQALQKSYDQDFANASLTDAQKLQAEQNLAAGKAAIQTAAAQQARELAARNNVEDLQYDQQAAAAESKAREQGIAGWAAAYQNAIAEINAQEQQRLAKLQEDAQKEGLTDQEVAQRRVDIERSANAEIVAQQEQLQHQVAGMLQQAFTNPVEFIKSKMEQMMFEIIASWLMRLNMFKTLFGTTLGGMQAGGGSGAQGGAGGLLGAVMGTASHSSVLGGYGGAPSGTTGVIAGGAMLPGGSTGAAVPGGYASAGGGSTGISSMAGTAISGAHDFSSLYSTFGNPGSSPTPSATSLSTTAASGDSSYADNGESGGFAGYMTGDDSDMSGILSDPDSVGANASAQVQATNAGVASSSAGGGLAAGIGIVGAAGAAYSGGKDVYESFFQSGVKGALDGTMGGAAAGAAIGSFAGPLGTVVGGAIGAGAGLVTNLIGQAFDESQKMAAREYYRKTLFPELDGLDKNQSGGDYLSAVSQVNRVSSQGYTYMATHFNAEAANWVRDNYLAKETTLVTADIMRRARSGGAYIGKTAAEFHTGGIIGSFGDFSTSSTEGFIHAKRGEGIVTDGAMRGHAPMIQAINSGADAGEMAARYMMASSGARSSGPATGNSYHTHHYNAIDAKSFGRYLDSGGMKVIQDSANRRASLYSGDSASG